VITINPDKGRPFSKIGVKDNAITCIARGSIVVRSAEKYSFEERKKTAQVLAVGRGEKWGS